jgi:hypothetical protein
MTGGIQLESAGGGGVGLEDLLFGPYGGFFSGAYYGPAGTGENAGGTVTNGDLRLLPMWVPSSVTFDRIGVNHFATTGSAGSVIRLGVYSWDSLTSMSLVLDAGTVAGDTAPTRKEITISLSLSAGLYMVGAVGQGAPATVPQISRLTANSSPLVQSVWARGQNSNFSVTCRGFQRAGITGALPSSITVARADFETSNDMFFVWLRAQ